MSRLLITIFCLLTITEMANAQQKTFTITGVVADSISNTPLLGVYVTSPTQGGQTNSEGEYTIKDVKPGKVIIKTMYFESYYMETQEFELRNDTVINFKLRDKSTKADEVVVTGTRTYKRLSDTPVLTTVINSVDIQRSAATNVAEALQDNIPGMIVSTGAMGTTVNIRGLNTRYVVFLVDGERLIAEGAGGSINLDQIDVNNIQKIEVINGAASALYGSNAVGAVVNIITKKPVHKFQAGANIVGESNNTLRTRANVGFKLKKVDGAASAFRNSSDGFESEEGRPGATKYEDYGANLKFGYKPIKGLNLNINSKFFSHETFNPEGSLNVAHSLKYTIGAGFNGDYTTQNKKNNTRFSVNYDNYLDYNVLELKDDELKRENEIYYLSTRAIHTFVPNEKLEVVGGLEFNKESNFSNTTLGEKFNKTIEDYNIFGQAQYEILKNFDIVAGARYTYNSAFSSAFSPKISLMYKTNGFTFRGGVGTSYRAPSIKELYYDFDHQGMFWIYGNPDLKAENGLYSSVSAEYNKGYFNISASPYFNKIDNKITQFDLLNTETNILEKHYKNVSSATLTGVDISATYTFFRQLELKANYSYSHAIDNSTGQQLDGNMLHSGTTAITWKGKIVRSPISIQFAGRVTSPRQYSEIDSEGNISVTESNPYNIWKIAIVKPFRIKKHTIEVSLKADNVFNFKDPSYVNSGTQYLVGIRYAFK